MFSNETYLFRNASEHGNRCGDEYRVNTAALALYKRTREQARFSRLAARLTNRNPRHLRMLSAATGGRRIASRRYAGLQTVAISQIAGSVDRADDFDADLRPLRESTQQRWLRVATARSEGKALPPVELIRIGEVYFIQDGHHRASVARARGESEIEAEVTDWQLD